MKPYYCAFLLLLTTRSLFAQIDTELLRRTDTLPDSLKLNMDAVYQRPMLQAGKLPVALGGYMEANYQYLQEDGVTEGHQFQMRRLTLFVSSAISKRLKFLTEIEFEDGTKEINIEFASVDLEFSPLFNVRTGIVMNPIGAFNQNHDGPKWEFVDRPVSATQMLPATWSTVGAGLFGKKYTANWVYGYELYLTNGFDDRIISNTSNRTYLPASKENKNRFEESFNGSPLLTGKIALKRRNIGEIGFSHMRGVYNQYEVDGIVLDQKRRVSVFALDFNTILPLLNSAINAEWAWIRVDVPATYPDQFGSRQAGGFMDIVQPVWKRSVFGLENSVINLALRLEYADWNKDRFRSTGDKIGDERFSIVPAISWRPTEQTVFRVNYRYDRQKDVPGNPPARMAGFQIGISTYF